MPINKNSKHNICFSNIMFILQFILEKVLSPEERRFVDNTFILEQSVVMRNELKYFEKYLHYLKSSENKSYNNLFQQFHNNNFLGKLPQSSNEEIFRFMIQFYFSVVLSNDLLYHINFSNNVIIVFSSIKSFVLAEHEIVLFQSTLREKIIMREKHNNQNNQNNIIKNGGAPKYNILCVIFILLNYFQTACAPDNPVIPYNWTTLEELKVESILEPYNTSPLVQIEHMENTEYVLIEYIKEQLQVPENNTKVIKDILIEISKPTKPPKTLEDKPNNLYKNFGSKIFVGLTKIVEQVFQEETLSVIIGKKVEQYNISTSLVLKFLYASSNILNYIFIVEGFVNDLPEHFPLKDYLQESLNKAIVDNEMKTMYNLHLPIGTCIVNVSDKIEFFVNKMIIFLSNYYQADINNTPILEAEGSYILSSQVDKVINKYKKSEQYNEWYKSHKEQHKLLLDKPNEYAHIVKQSRKKKKKKKKSKTYKKHTKTHKNTQKHTKTHKNVFK